MKRTTRHYGVFLFGSETAGDPRYDAGWWEGDRGKTRPGAPVFVEECSSHKEAIRRANELNEAEGLMVSW